MKTALIAIGRRENQYAREWVKHHLALGFDHIYIYDNNHDGEEMFIDVLMDYVEQGRVTIIDYRNQEKAQRPAYNDAYRRVSSHYDWLAFFDFDEFLCLGRTEEEGRTDSTDGTDIFAAYERQGEGRTDSTDGTDGEKPLRAFLGGLPQEYNCVMVPWLMMTDSGLVRNDGRPLMQRFTESTTRGGGQGKCIVRGGIGGLRFTNSVHVPYEPLLRCCTPKGEPTIQKRHQPEDTTVAYLKHFSTKTIEEWLSNKMQKGAAGITYDTFREKYKDYFFTINERTPEKEAFINNYRKNHKL